MLVFVPSGQSNEERVDSILQRCYSSHKLRGKIQDVSHTRRIKLLVCLLALSFLSSKVIPHLFCLPAVQRYFIGVGAGECDLYASQRVIRCLHPCASPPSIPLSPKPIHHTQCSSGASSPTPRPSTPPPRRALAKPIMNLYRAHPTGLLGSYVNVLFANLPDSEGQKPSCFAVGEPSPNFVRIVVEPIAKW